MPFLSTIIDIWDHRYLIRIVKKDSDFVKLHSKVLGNRLIYDGFVTIRWKYLWFCEINLSWFYILIGYIAILTIWIQKCKNNVNKNIILNNLNLITTKKSNSLRAQTVVSISGVKSAMQLSNLFGPLNNCWIFSSLSYNHTSYRVLLPPVCF